VELREVGGRGAIAYGLRAALQLKTTCPVLSAEQLFGYGLGRDLGDKKMAVPLVVSRAHALTDDRKVAIRACASRMRPGL